MDRRCKKILPPAALASLLTLACGVTRADSLVTTDGDMYLGSVTKTETGYTVNTADGPVNVEADKVKKVLYDHPHANPTQTTPAQSTSITPAPADKVKDPQMLKALLGQGTVAFVNGQYEDARDAFTDALTMDPKNPVASRGLGFSYLKLGKTAKAVKPLEVVAQVQPMDRGLTMGLSAALLASGDPTRALKLIDAYLQAHPKPMDERMLNALGTTLSRMDRLATTGSLYADAVKLYLKLNDQLNATQPGKKRWGVDWLPEKEVAQHDKERNAAQQKVTQTQNQLEAATARVQTAQNALRNALNSTAVHEIRDGQIRVAQDQLNNAQAEQEKKQSAYDDAAKALADLPGPDFPPQISLDHVRLALDPTSAGQDDVDPPAGSAPVVATATSPPAHQDSSPQPTDPPANTDPSPASPAVAPSKADKHVTRYAVAFAIAPDVLVTAASAVEDANDIQITTSEGKTFKAVVLRAHHADGLALLKADGAGLPVLVLANAVDPNATGDLTCLSFPQVDLFNPLPKSMTASGGNQADTWTVKFDDSPRLPGGPLIRGTTVVGVELGDRDSDLTQVPAATLKSLLSLVQDSADAAKPATDPAKAVAQVMAEQ